MRRRSLVCLALLLTLAGCVSSDERRKLHDTPPPAHHATPAVRRAVAAMAIRTSKYPARVLAIAAREPKFTAFHGMDQGLAFGGSIRTFYCVQAGIEPMVLGKPVGLPIMEWINATVRITDLPNGKTQMVSTNYPCGKEPTEPFPELISVARDAVEAAKNRPVVTPVVGSDR